MDLSLRVDPEHFDYLKIQKGNLDRFASDRFDWMVRYQEDLRDQYESIRPHLPRQCGAFLDVGSGLGGIDVLIRRHYVERGRDPEVNLLDGLDDPPEMKLHRQTFNNMRIARNFQVKNGCPPQKLVAYGPQAPEFESKFDLVVSFGSWCFHYPTELYLARVKQALAPKAVVILEVRAEKEDWLRALVDNFGAPVMILKRPKWSRLVFGNAGA